MTQTSSDISSSCSNTCYASNLHGGLISGCFHSQIIPKARVYQSGGQKRTKSSSVAQMQSLHSRSVFRYGRSNGGEESHFFKITLAMETTHTFFSSGLLPYLIVGVFDHR